MRQTAHLHAFTVAALLVLALGALGAHCNAARDGARTVLTATAQGVHEGSEAAVDHYEASDCNTTEDVEELRRCVQSLRDVAEARQVARAALLEGESILDAWDHGSTEPEDWAGWLETVGQALARLVGVLETAGVEVPEELTSAAATLDTYLERRRE